MPGENEAAAVDVQPADPSHKKHRLTAEQQFILRNSPTNPLPPSPPVPPSPKHSRKGLDSMETSLSGLGAEEKTMEFLMSRVEDLEKQKEDLEAMAESTLTTQRFLAESHDLEAHTHAVEKAELAKDISKLQTHVTTLTEQKAAAVSEAEAAKTNWQVQIAQLTQEIKQKKAKLEERGEAMNGLLGEMEQQESKHEEAIKALQSTLDEKQQSLTEAETRSHSMLEAQNTQNQLVEANKKIITSLEAKLREAESSHLRKDNQMQQLRTQADASAEKLEKMLKMMPEVLTEAEAAERKLQAELEQQKQQAEGWFTQVGEQKQLVQELEARLQQPVWVEHKQSELELKASLEECKQQWQDETTELREQLKASVRATMVAEATKHQSVAAEATKHQSVAAEATKHQSELSALQAEMAAKQDTMEGELTEHETKLGALVSKNTELEDAVVALQAEVAEKEKALEKQAASASGLVAAKDQDLENVMVLEKHTISGLEARIAELMMKEERSAEALSECKDQLAALQRSAMNTQHSAMEHMNESATWSQTKKQLEAELDALKEEAASSTDSLATLKTQLTESQTTLAETDARLKYALLQAGGSGDEGDLVLELAKLEGAVVALQAEVAEKEEALEKQAVNVSELETQIAELMVKEERSVEALSECKDEVAALEDKLKEQNQLEIQVHNTGVTLAECKRAWELDMEEMEAKQAELSNENLKAEQKLHELDDELAEKLEAVANLDTKLTGSKQQEKASRDKNTKLECDINSIEGQLTAQEQALIEVNSRYETDVAVLEHKISQVGRELIQATTQSVYEISMLKGKLAEKDQEMAQIKMTSMHQQKVAEDALLPLMNSQNQNLLLRSPGHDPVTRGMFALHCMCCF